MLAEHRVRFAGERVAAVAAADRDTAEEALALIDVEYEELPAVFDPLAALEEEAPILHPEVNSYLGLPKPLDKPSNAFAGIPGARATSMRALPRRTSSSKTRLRCRGNTRPTWSPTPASYGSTIGTGTGLGFQQSAIPRQGAIICRAAAPQGAYSPQSCRHWR